MISALRVGNGSSVNHELAVSTGSGGGCNSWKVQEVISLASLSIFSELGGCRFQFWFWAVCLYGMGRAENTSLSYWVTSGKSESKFSPIDEWIKNLWCVWTVEYYSAMKRNAVESVLVKWMNLEPVIQNEVSQKEENQLCMLMLMYEI